MQNAPNPVTQKEKIAGKGKKKKKLIKKPAKKVGVNLMDQLVEKAKQMGALKPAMAGLPGQKTIVKIP